MRPVADPAECAQNLLDRLSINDIPVPVEQVATAVGAQVRFFPLDDELSGMIFIKGGKPIIGVNALHHPHRQRFTIAHEIGHFLLHRTRIENRVHVDKKFIVYRDARSAHGSDLIEVQANRFAAALLMPKPFLTKVLAEEEYDIDDEQPTEALAKRLRVSKQALEFRIMSLFQTK